jgi:hypothetical protein
MTGHQNSEHGSVRRLRTVHERRREWNRAGYRISLQSSGQTFCTVRQLLVSHLTASKGDRCARWKLFTGPKKSSPRQTLRICRLTHSVQEPDPWLNLAVAGKSAHCGVRYLCLPNFSGRNVHARYGISGIHAACVNRQVRGNTRLNGWWRQTLDIDILNFRRIFLPGEPPVLLDSICLELLGLKLLDAFP